MKLELRSGVARSRRRRQIFSSGERETHSGRCRAIVHGFFKRKLSCSPGPNSILTELKLLNQQQSYPKKPLGPALNPNLLHPTPDKASLDLYWKIPLISHLINNLICLSLCDINHHHHCHHGHQHHPTIPCILNKTFPLIKHLRIHGLI